MDAGPIRGQARSEIAVFEGQQGVEQRPGVLGSWDGITSSVVGKDTLPLLRRSADVVHFFDSTGFGGLAKIVLS
jgi:hypothetical protein